ncbi:lbp-3 [Pristionchus pacificus]|uniref:Lbp-3 n=1 Tax=Pristionchus pacificus TaxID=54126 RepID=A0A2A6CL77_PRIPA|nr:lbp-3 [Pristionchus pacificus]|eukprot:PDM78869.1 lbp-3 [Pristionchus pacificus]
MRLLGLLLFCLAVSVSASSIPEKFFGRFKIDRSENFDEFLSAKGVGFITRQLIKLASVTKVFAKGEAEGTYVYENLSSKKDVKYTFKLGEQFTAEGLDSTQHEITFDVKGDEVTEHHKRVGNPDVSPETYHYTISEDNSELIMTMTNNGITCKRFLKRE